jgi:hypothetical protein
MSTRPDRHPFSTRPLDRVRISDPGEIAAAVPQLLGFRPRESVVLVCLGGTRGNRVGLTVRADIPRRGLEVPSAGALARSVATGRPDAVIAVLVSEAPDDPGAAGPDLPHRSLLHDLTMVLARAGIPVRSALLVRAGRWWCYDCPEACCRPGAGTPLPGGVTQLAAASVASGMVVADSREDLARRIAADPGRLGTLDACRRLDGVDGDAWAAVGEALRLSSPGAATTATRLPDELVARVLRALQDPAVRDRALGLALAQDAAAAEALWTECTRRAPDMLAAAPATLLAVSAWLRGDGAMANIALERALEAEPGYRLARLLFPALAACLPPAELRAMIAGSTGPGPDC